MPAARNTVDGFEVVSSLLGDLLQQPIDNVAVRIDKGEALATSEVLTRKDAEKGCSCLRPFGR